MKAYTDISQSKKLANILPLESADMVLQEYETGDYHSQEWIHKPSTSIHEIPAWSLAALLGVLPKNLNIGRPSLESNYKGYYWIQYYDEFMKPNNYKTECFNNPVDACVAMIERLHKLNLL